MTRPVDLERLVQDLNEIVGAEQVIFSGERFDAASKDATEIVHPPTAVVEITSLDQIPRLILMAKNHGIGLIARGAGTGLSGGALAEDGGVVLLLDRFNNIISIDKEKQIAVVEPAVITQDLADHAAANGLFYPPDPASVAESTVAGNVAECAGGLQCRKYGVTKDYVLGVEGYDGDANFIQTGIFAEDEIYDLTSLIVGSEGTLLIITKIALQLIKPPEARRTFLATFATQDDAARVVSEIMAAGIIPAVLEFMDSDAVACSLAYLKEQGALREDDDLARDKSVAALLLIELDGTPDEIERDSKGVKEIVKRHKPVKFSETDDSDQREYHWLVRRSLSKAVTAAAPLRVSEDVCVPPSKLPTLVEFLPSLADEFGLRVNSYGHAGDGNLHVNFLAAEDSEEKQRAIAYAAGKLFRRTLELGGTISGEHGIGIAKRGFLELEVSPRTMEIFRRIKLVFDPDNIINPGKIFEYQEE